MSPMPFPFAWETSMQYQALLSFLTLAPGQGNEFRSIWSIYLKGNQQWPCKADPVFPEPCWAFQGVMCRASLPPWDQKALSDQHSSPKTLNLPGATPGVFTPSAFIRHLKGKGVRQGPITPMPCDILIPLQGELVPDHVKESKLSSFSMCILFLKGLDCKVITKGNMV